MGTQPLAGTKSTFGFTGYLCYSNQHIRFAHNRCGSKSVIAAGHFTSFEQPKVPVRDLRTVFETGVPTYDVVPSKDAYWDGFNQLCLFMWTWKYTEF